MKVTASMKRENVRGDSRTFMVHCEMDFTNGHEKEREPVSAPLLKTCPAPALQTALPGQLQKKITTLSAVHIEVRPESTIC